MKEKKKLRYNIWDTLEFKKLSTQKQPHGRIPDFIGSTAAAKMLRSTEEWNSSKIIFSSPDSAQKKVREFALKDEKLLIMASPKLKNGYIILNPFDVKGNEKEASTINGAFKYGNQLEKFPKVDLVIEGSVAVDIKGNRLGKGGGYGDVELNHLFEENSINKDTPIVTTVHEIQIVDNVPTEVHDQKINMIVTPKRVIRI
jgi:5-formyltetrahydrofolate cyclo-ligase